MKSSLKIKKISDEGFTLIEMLVSMAVLALMLVMLTEVLSSAQKIWSTSISSTQQFREARVAFEAMNRRISQAIINTYWDYDNPNSPKYYVRQSDLAFICGPRDGILKNSMTQPTDTGNKDGYTDAIFFIAPLGYTATNDATAGVNQLNSLLNAWGYYIAYESDVSGRPPFLQAATSIIPIKKRFRLYEFRQPSESLQIYKDNYIGETYASGTGILTIQQSGAQNNGTRVAVDLTRAWYQSILAPSGSASDSTLIPQNGSTFSDGSEARIIADNIIALIISPRNPGLYRNNAPYPDFYYAPNYYYDSRGCLINGTLLTGSSASNNSQIVNTGNTLPPMVQVTMIALDETSAARYDLLHSKEPPLLAAGGGFFQTISKDNPPGQTSTDDKYQADLVNLEKWLTDQHLSYQVFRTSIPIRSAKFSAPQ